MNREIDDAQTKNRRLSHLAPQGMAGFFLGNGSKFFNEFGEGDIRRAFIEVSLVDCRVVLQFFGNN